MAGTPQASMYYSIARTYCLSGNTQKALEYLVKTLNTGIPCSEKLEEDPSFDALRKDSTFLSLIEASKLVDAARQSQEEGDKEHAQATLLQAVNRAPFYAYPSYLLARHLSLEGHSGKALAALNEAIEKGFRDFCLIMEEEAFQPLRGSREFQNLLKTPRTALSRSESAAVPQDISRTGKKI